jgi:Cu(I)/Ag(I) efflux system periplasmic protein CusF
MKNWIIAIAVGLAVTLPALAQSGAPPAHGAKSPAASSEIYEGQVRRINKEMGRVSIAHGPLKAYNMGPMTMAFPVKNPKQLDAIKEGDKVRFTLEPSGDNLVVTRIEVAK